ncbi:hypothetical protein HK096_004632, partial [Nowakowskiella sp. JEL0078]
MSFKPIPLPFALNELEPYISAETVDFHYNKHHTGYSVKLNNLVKDTSLATSTLEEILKHPENLEIPVFQSAAQIWNHDFLWQSLAPPSKSAAGPSDKLRELLVRDFGSLEAFKKKFSDLAIGHFGSGWVWLVLNNTTGKLDVIGTHDAENPLA